MLCDGRYGKGIFFGTVSIKQRSGLMDFLRTHTTVFSVIRPLNDEGNALIIGGSGSAKSSGIVIPTITKTWNKPFIAVDIKGELRREYVKSEHAECFKVFSLTEEQGNTYDPYRFLHQDQDDNLVSNVKEIAQSLIPLPISIYDPFWIQAAQSFLTAAILYYYHLEKSFIETMMAVIATPISKIIQIICSSDYNIAKIFVNNLTADIVDDADDTVNNVLSDSKMLTGIGQEITNRLSIFADQRVIKALEPNDDSISWDDTKACNTFISVPEDRLEQYNPVLTMILTQLIRALERRPEKHSVEGTKIPPLLLMLDEFPRLGKIDAIASAVSTLRSKGVTTVIVCQSLAQLDAIYGENIRRIILDNCQYKAIMGAGDDETQESLSKLIGTKLVPSNSIGISYNSYGQISGYNYQFSKVRQPAIFPYELSSQRDREILITPEGYCLIDKKSYFDKR